MRTRFFLLLLLGFLLVACGPTPEAAPPSPAAVASAVVLTETAVPEPTPAPTTEPMPTATATRAPTVAPTLEPTVEPEMEIDPFTLARQLLKQVNVTPPEGRRIEPCEGEAPILCVNSGQENTGYVELLIFPLNSYPEDHPVRLAAETLPADPAAYTAEQETAVSQALTALAEEHLAVIAADRAITYPDDTFTPLPIEPAHMGALPAMSFGFVHTNETGEVVERYLNVAAFDRRFIYWLGINFDPANVTTFISDTAVTQFAPFFLKIAASLPLLRAAAAELPPLPPLTLYPDNSDAIPPSVAWTLAAELPDSPTAVTVLSQPGRPEPLTAEAAAFLAQTYGFDGPLYVESRRGLSTDQAIESGLFAAFDESHTLSFAGPPYRYSDAAHQNQGPDLPFAQAAPIAEQFLQENGWLTYPYETAVSDEGQGVVFFPLIDDGLLLTPAHSVRVAGNGGIVSMAIYPLENLNPIGRYPLITAEAAWSQVQNPADNGGVFYRLVPAADETAVADSFPIVYNNIPAPGETGDFYTTIRAYRPLAGDSPPIIRSSDFLRITGDTAVLNELAEQTDSVVHVWGTVREFAPGLLELELSRWETAADAGGVPTFFGVVQQADDQAFLVDEANRSRYLLPDAPADLSAGDYAAVEGWPEMENEVNQLVWQSISVYPPPVESEPQATAVPPQAITINSARLVYLWQSAHTTGLPDNLFMPAWEFAGTADNGVAVTVWVTAVSSGGCTFQGAI